MYKILRIKDCREGMRVLLTHPNKSYEIGPNNPQVGTEWQCKGVIADFGSSIHVEWDNGHSNSYISNELSLILENYEAQGNCETIW